MRKILETINLGYTVDSEGIVYKPNKQVQKIRLGTRGYLLFSVRFGKKVKNIKVHRLQAYTLYGNSLFEDGIVVRHLDGDQLNNKSENIAIGSRSDNYFDIPNEKRTRMLKHITKKASEKNRKYDYETIKKDRDAGMSYKQLMIKYNISSKGTLSHIINSNY
jgi:hypothetical protein